MFSELLKSKAFKSVIKAFFQEYGTEVLDIILFGSAVKGKEKPKDIDILLLFKNKENLESAYMLRKKLEDLNLKFSVTTKTYQSLMAETFMAKEAFLSEGYSLINNTFISTGLGYTSFALFKYELRGFNQSQRMKFQYSLHGRNKRGGMLKELKLIKFADTILLSPIPSTDKTREYLSYWNIKFQEMPVLIPTRIVPKQ